MTTEPVKDFHNLKTYRNEKPTEYVFIFTAMM